MTAARKGFRLDIGTPSKPDAVSNSFVSLTAIKKAMAAQLATKRLWCLRFASGGLPAVDQALADVASIFTLDGRPVIIDCKFDPETGSTIRLTCWHDNY